MAVRFGRNLGISVGAAGSLLSALMQTGLGAGIWYVVPYGWSVRFSESSVAWLFRLSAVNQSELQAGILYGTIISCVIIIGFVVWFSKYNGAHTE